jgi:VanZ family protein
MIRDRRTLQRWSLAILALGTLAVITALLLSPEPVDRPLVALVDTLVPPLPGKQHSPLMPTAEFLANIVLFFPVGFFLVAATRRWWVGMIVGVLLSAACEAAQDFLPNRVASVSDVLANTMGALAGSVVGAIVMFLSETRRERRTPDPASDRDRVPEFDTAT